MTVRYRKPSPFSKTNTIVIASVLIQSRRRVYDQNSLLIKRHVSGVPCIINNSPQGGTHAYMRMLCIVEVAAQQISIA